jgi:hypothetical protein
MLAGNLALMLSLLLPRAGAFISGNRLARISPLRPYQVRVFGTETPTPGTSSTSTPVDYFSVINNDSIEAGDYSLIDSKAVTSRVYADVEAMDLSSVSGPRAGDKIWLRGRVSSVRAKGNVCFMVLRSNVFNTIQLCHFKDKQNPDASKQLIKFAGSIALESIVDIYGETPYPLYSITPL